MRIRVGIPLSIAIAVPLAMTPLAAPLAPQRVAVSTSPHFFAYQDGKPFFWLGDTAWLLFSKLDRAETEKYLEDRRSKGFTVIQVSVLHSAAMKSASGVPALMGGDPAKPNVTPGADPAKPGEYDYWDHVDWVVDQAAERGIYLAMIPAWGSLVKGRQLNEGNVAAYAAFLARRYKSKPNIFWVAGGDIQGGDNPAVWNMLGRTLKNEDPGHLITFHPFGRMQSSMWFHEERWLDFNMFQSGHQRYDQDTSSPHKYGEDNWRYVRDDYARIPAKPVIDGEPSYEGIPQGLHDTTQPYWTAADARRYGYWSVFAGAAGHTYGDNAVMQFYKPDDRAAAYGAKKYWFDAINDPGAGQMRYLKDLMLSRPYFERTPDLTSAVGENGTKHDYVIATRGASYLFAYTYSGKPFRIRLGAITGARVQASWYNPRDGSAQSIGTFANQGERSFTPPGERREGNDWVLVIDDASRNFQRPGRR
jgi:Protein of unknown function (DUF4038)/Putative collagen-binding domain of a collagenase